MRGRVCVRTWGSGRWGAEGKRRGGGGGEAGRLGERKGECVDARAARVCVVSACLFSFFFVAGNNLDFP